MHQTADRFTAALEALHTDRDADQIAELFTDSAELSKAGVPHQEHGQAGAQAFWSDYRDQFDQIEATFTNRTTTEDTAVLEWTSSGTLAGGHPIEYAGVSVLQGDESGISSFRTYYDTAAFLPGPERS